MSDEALRPLRTVRGGPMLVRGPVHTTLADGAVVDSDRFMVAICLCKRSGIYPLCDTSHRHPRCMRETA
jgi:CDGSH-type Zn-finger protein